VIYTYFSSVCLYVCLPKLVYTIHCVMAALVPGSLCVFMVSIIRWLSFMVYSLWSFIAPAPCAP